MRCFLQSTQPRAAVRHSRSTISTSGGGEKISWNGKRLQLSGLPGSCRRARAGSVTMAATESSSPGFGSAVPPSSGSVLVDVVGDAEAAWVVDYYPHEAVEELADGGLRVVLPVASTRWLEQLLVRLGPAAEVVALTGELPATAGTDAARRVLARYRR